MSADTDGVDLPDQRQRFEAWADDQGFPLRKLDTSDDYLDLRTQGAWDAWQACAARGVVAAAPGYGVNAAETPPRHDKVTAPGVDLPDGGQSNG